MQADKADTQQRVQFRAASCRGHLVWVERVRALHRGVSVYRPTGSSSGAETEKPVGSAERDTKVRHSSTGCEQVQNIAHLRTVSGTAIIDNESSNQGSLMIGGRMSRKPNSIGQFAVRVIEDARIDLLSSLLLLRENETEPDFGLPDEVPDHADFDAACEFRKEVIEALSQFDSDDLRPIENRCRRVKTLADGKRAEEFSKIGIAVAYSKEGDGRARTLNITIAGSKSCNLQSNKDPEERSFGYPMPPRFPSARLPAVSGQSRVRFDHAFQILELVETQRTNALT